MNKKSTLLILLIAGVMLLPGCKSKHEKVMDEMLDNMEEMVDIMESVTDEASAKDAQAKFKEQ